MIAAQGGGRASEQQHGGDPFHRPSTANSFRSPKSGNNSRNSTPSVSPLSNASRSGREPNEQFELSNVNRGDVNDLGDVGGHPVDTAPSPAKSDADRSSSLSDFEGSLEDDDRLDIEDTPRQVAEVENESEAETEKLGRTPQKPWKIGDVGRTPSKLNHESTLDDDLSDAESVLTPKARESPSTKTSRQPSEVAGRKRKRTSPLSDAESSLSEESDSDHAMSVSKRRTSHRSGKPLAWDPSGQNAMGAKLEEEVEQMDTEQDEILDEDLVEQLVSPSKVGRQKRGRGRGRIQKEQSPGKLPEEKTVEEADEVAEPVEEEEEDSTEGLSAEEVERREVAEQYYVNLSEHFRGIRKFLHDDRVAAAEAELVQLQQEYPNHPEYLAQLQAVTLRRDTKMQQEMKLHQYKKQALRNDVLGSRSQLLSQYYQEAREIREDVLYDLGKEWYDIQKERRAAQADEVDRYTYTFPTKRSEQVRQQAKYNLELSILSGIAKHVGFPAAPEIEGARNREVDDDFKAMKITQKQPYAFPYVSTSEYREHIQPTQMPTSDHIAQKEFLEQTPWANPHHPVHQQSRTPSAFGHRPLGLQAAGQQAGMPMPMQGPSPFATPLPGVQRNGERENPPDSNETVGAHSDPPSSAPHAAAPGDRVHLMAFDHTANGSPTGQPKRAIGQRRDFSGLSSASTIDAPNDSGDGPVPHMPMGDSAPNQAFMTSAIHARNGEERRPELYEGVDFRRIGAFGAPKPMGQGHHTMEKSIPTNAS